MLENRQARPLLSRLLVAPYACRPQPGQAFALRIAGWVVETLYYEHESD